MSFDMRQAMLYREYMEDCGAPEVEMIRSGTRRRTRKERKLNCGHTVPPGTAYDETVCLVDGEFTVDHECAVCWQDRELYY